MDELKNISPNLSKISKKDCFEVPGEYFDTLPHLVQARCIEESRPKTFSFKSINPVLKFGSLLVVLFALVFLYQRNQKVEIQQADSEDVLNYLDNDAIYQLDENLLAEEVNNDLMNQSDSSETLSEIEEYLINSDINESILLDEL